MARERRLPSARSSDTSSNKKGKGPAESQDHKDQPAAEKDDTSHAAASSVGDGMNKHDEHEQNFSSEVADTRAFSQLVQDYGDDSKCRHLLLYSRICDRSCERQTLISW